MTHIKNPWLDLPDFAPYAVPADRPLLERFNRKWGEGSKRYIDLELPPDPIIGLREEAPIVVLSANPGRSPGDYDHFQRPGAAHAALEDARSPIGSPVRWLDDDLQDTPGGSWWRRLLGGWWRLGYDYDDLARKFLLLEFHGYHSQVRYPLPDVLPSQYYGFHLVERAIERDAVVVILRARKPWLQGVPKLTDYKRLTATKSPQAASIGPGNLDSTGSKMVRRALGQPAAPERAWGSRL